MHDLTLGQRIAAKRNELGLSQSALGEQLGVSRQSVFKWESDAAIPEIDKLIALSRLFGVSLDWLLGIGDVPRTGAPESPEQQVTEEEKQALDRFIRQKAVLPRWMKMAAVAAVACAAVAMMISCISLYQSARAREQIRHIQAQAEQLESYIQSMIPTTTKVVQEFDYDCTPAPDGSDAKVRMRIVPYGYREGQSASLSILLGGQVQYVHSCSWTGVNWETEFDLAPADGYQFLFRITDEAGLELTQELNAPILNQLGLNLAWPTNYSITWKQAQVQNDSITFTDLHVQIPLPGVFRYSTELWESCDLVLTNDAGEELCRVDLMNRSGYSAQIDFGGSDVDFTTQTVELIFEEPDVGDHLRLNLECALNTGHQFFCPVDTWKMQSDGLTNHYTEPRT